MRAIIVSALMCVLKESSSQVLSSDNAENTTPEAHPKSEKFLLSESDARWLLSLQHLDHQEMDRFSKRNAQQGNSAAHAKETKKEGAKGEQSNAHARVYDPDWDHVRDIQEDVKHNHLHHIVGPYPLPGEKKATEAFDHRIPASKKQARFSLSAMMREKQSIKTIGYYPDSVVPDLKTQGVSSHDELHYGAEAVTLERLMMTSNEQRNQHYSQAMLVLAMIVFFSWHLGLCLYLGTSLSDSARSRRDLSGKTKSHRHDPEKCHRQPISSAASGQ